jgi:hypothetical protein
MKKIRYILMYEGRVEYDFTNNSTKPKLKESISIEKEKECLNYTVKFIQHFFNEQGEFQYIMVSGIRK